MYFQHLRLTFFAELCCIRTMLTTVSSFLGTFDTHKMYIFVFSSGRRN